MVKFRASDVNFFFTCIFCFVIILKIIGIFDLVDEVQAAFAV